MTSKQKLCVTMLGIVLCIAAFVVAFVITVSGCNGVELLDDAGFDTETPITLNEIQEPLEDLGTGIVVGVTTGNWMIAVSAAVGLIVSFIAGRRKAKQPTDALNLITGAIYESNARRVVDRVDRALDVPGNEKLKTYVTGVVNTNETNLNEK